MKFHPPVANGTVLGEISKRGDRYLLALCVQAAWVVFGKPTTGKRHGPSSWIEAAKKRLDSNVLAVALADKLARIARASWLATPIAAEWIGY